MNKVYKNFPMIISFLFMVSCGNETRTLSSSLAADNPETIYNEDFYIHCPGKVGVDSDGKMFAFGHEVKIKARHAEPKSSIAPGVVWYSEFFADRDYGEVFIAIRYFSHFYEKITVTKHASNGLRADFDLFNQAEVSGDGWNGECYVNEAVLSLQSEP